MSLLQRQIDADGVLLNPKTWDKVDARTLFTEADCTGALLLLKSYELIIYGWYDAVEPLEIIIE